MAKLKSLCLLVAVSLLAGVGSAQFGNPSKVVQPARAELIADVKAIEAGKPFRLGVRYTMQPGWHIYWINPGDTGLRTKIDWQLPEGFTAGPLHWPVPHHFVLGGLTSYAYEDEVILFAEITPPAELTDKDFTFKANSSWLVCKESCVPGKASLELKLSAGTAAPSPALTDFEAQALQTPAGFFAGEAATESQVQAVGVAFEPNFPEIKSDGSATIRVLLTPLDDKTFDTKASPELLPRIFPYVPSNFSTEDPTLSEFTSERIVFDWAISAGTLTQAETPLHLALRVPIAGQEVLAAATLNVRTAAQVAAAAPASGVTPPTLAQQAAPIPVAEAPAETGPVFSFLTSAPIQSGEGSLAYFLMLAFLGGLILNIMPCVLPVISLKVLGFVRQSGESPRRRLNLGLMFGVGVLVSFAALAFATIAVTAAGDQAGWGFQMTQPRFVMVLAAIVLAFALSLFGVFTIELPGSAANKVAQGAQGEGYGGSFMNGVLATLLATPCTAPFLAPAAAFLLQRSAPVILLFFLTVGAGLAAPYIILAANPRLLRWMPKPGRWMETLKQLMGFALVATLIWLLWVLGAQVGNDALLMVMAWLVLVAFACWLLGRAASRRGQRAAWIAAILLVGGGYLLPEGAVRPAAASASADDAGIPWEPFSIERVEELAASGKTVFLDFTADWCVTCKANERLVLETAPVRKALRDNQIVALRGDWTNGDPTISRVLETFGSSGVPLYVIFPGGSPGEPIVLPSALTRDLVVNQLNAAAGIPRVASR